MWITKEEINVAWQRIGSYVRVTPTVHLNPDCLDVDADVVLKLELMQVTGCSKS